jgi:simple sugar transport system ATP-binding protein
MAMRTSGTAILLISEELDEILALADRIEVMYEGRFVGSFPAADADIGRIGLLMTGGDEGDDADPTRQNPPSAEATREPAP